jgi:HAD superfamily hydrolase (TIGR01509 family)
MIRAFLFDFDGLIMDTEYPRYMGWKHIYEMYGCDLTPDDYARCVGRSDVHFDFRADLAARANAPIDWREADRERQQVRLSILAEERDLPGVRDLVEEASRIGIMMAIASSSPREWVHEQLQRVSMFNFFACIITADDVIRSKPDPACYVKALANIAAASHEAVAFEDSPVGCSAALDAGLAVVVVTNRVTRHLAFPSQVLKLESLAGVRVDNIMSYFERSAGVTSVF